MAFRVKGKVLAMASRALRGPVPCPAPFRLLSSSHTGLWLFLLHPKHAHATTIWASHQLFPGPGKRFPPTPASTHSFISFRSSLKSHHFQEANSKHLINTATCPPSPCCLLPCSAFVPTAFVISKKTYLLIVLTVCPARGQDLCFVPQCLLNAQNDA